MMGEGRSKPGKDWGMWTRKIGGFLDVRGLLFR